jgi:hypothetical protein
MTVALGHDLNDDAAAVLAMLTFAASLELMVITVKPNALASNPQLATRTPTRVPMTFIAQPFRLNRARTNCESALPMRGRR